MFKIKFDIPNSIDIGAVDLHRGGGWIYIGTVGRWIYIGDGAVDLHRGGGFTQGRWGGGGGGFTYGRWGGGAVGGGWWGGGRWIYKVTHFIPC